MRVRLELGREDHNDISDTVVNYQTDRVVDFSKQDYLGEAEELDPARIGATSLHAGSPVTAKPVLPQGIEPRHLALLANDAVISQTRARVLTPSPDRNA